ncbi:MAG: hypothetical protein P1U65_13645 [Minwuia sp.]|nr:hypothetical protein [Minwuia sp.]
MDEIGKENIWVRLRRLVVPAILLGGSPWYYDTLLFSISKYVNPPELLQKNLTMGRTAQQFEGCDSQNPVQITKNPEVFLGMGGTHLGGYGIDAELTGSNDGDSLSDFEQRINKVIKNALIKQSYRFVGVDWIISDNNIMSSPSVLRIPVNGSRLIRLDSAHDLYLGTYAINSDRPDCIATIEIDLVLRR